MDTSGSTTVGTMYYTYDNDGRVATRSGTLFQSVLPSAMVGAAYDADNRLCMWNVASPSCGSPTITWDQNGNLTNDGTHTYTWDARNRLTAIAAYSAAYTYDALGRRLSNKKGATTTSFVYDFSNIVQEQKSGVASANLLTGFGVDERFTRIVVGGATGVFLTDALGSTLATASTSAAITTNFAYDPFGNTTVSGTAGTNTYEFTGRENDGTGLYYNRARYYNPAWGRFISEDPIGFAGGINKYAYVGNDPTNARDSSGLQELLLENPLYGPVPLPDPAAPLPPGWTPDWDWDLSPWRPGDYEPRWLPPEGGEWRWDPDPYKNHPEYPDGHWDYNPRNGRGSSWERFPPSSPPMAPGYNCKNDPTCA